VLNRFGFWCGSSAKADLRNAAKKLDAQNE